MKICFLSSMHPARDKRVFDKEAVYLAAAGYSVSHLCPGEADEAGEENGVRITTYHKPSGIRARISQSLQLYRMAKAENPDVYHCNEVDSWMIGLVLRLFNGKRCVFDVHEHYPSTFAESRFPQWTQPAVAAVVRGIFHLLTPFTDRFVLAKRSVSADFHTDDNKKVLVRNYTPLSGLNFANKCADTMAGDAITLLHLGLFSKVRGWPQVLDAMAVMANQNVRLEIIGEINDGSREEFERRVIELDLAGRVQIHDWMPFDEAFSHLLKAQIGLITFQPGILNHVYAMPHKMFDYMAAGLAILCPEFAVEVAPIVTESQCGYLVNTSDSDDIANKLDALIDNPQLLTQMGENGRKAVEDKYNWESEVEKLINMYKEMDNSK